MRKGENMEIWKEVEGTNGEYEVSNLGRIRHDGEIVKCYLNKGNGYIERNINHVKSKGVHRIVALAFCDNPNPEEYKEVNHIDGDKTNNKASNLEWVNRKLNMEHASKHGLINRDSEKRKEACKINQLKSVEINSFKCVEYDEDGSFIQIHDAYNDSDKDTVRMYRLSYCNHYYRDYNILFQRYGEIPVRIDVERIKNINDNRPKKYTSCKDGETVTYTAMKNLPITREQLWFCFNNEVTDKEGRMWNIERGTSYKAYPKEVMEQALEMLKTHTYNEVAEITGIHKSTLVKNNPNKRKLNRKK